MATNSIAHYEIYPTRGGFAVIRISGEGRAQVVEWFDDQMVAEDFVAVLNFVAEGPRRLASH